VEFKMFKIGLSVFQRLTNFLTTKKNQLSKRSLQLFNKLKLKSRIRSKSLPQKLKSLEDSDKSFLNLRLFTQKKRSIMMLSFKTWTKRRTSLKKKLNNYLMITNLKKVNSIITTFKTRFMMPSLRESEMKQSS